MISPVPEQWVELGAGAARMRAGFCAAAGAFLAGGPLELEFVVECRGTVPIHVLGGMERTTLRPALYSFRGQLEGSAVALDDPHPGAGLLGGPSGTSVVEPGEILRVPLLLNEFLLLERIRAQLPPGGAGVLRVHGERPLPPATSRPAAFSLGPDAPVVASDLRLAVRRDDEALERLIDSLRRAIEADVTNAVSAERRRAIDQLATLGGETAQRALEGLRGHPDPWLRTRLASAAARPIDPGPP